MNKQSKAILLTEKKDTISYLTLNRPSVLNALNHPLLLELKGALEKIKDDQEIRAVVISGAGDKAFSAGADIEYLHQASPLQVRELAKPAVKYFVYYSQEPVRE